MPDYTPDAETQEFLQQFTVAELEKQGKSMFVAEVWPRTQTGLDASARENI